MTELHGCHYRSTGPVQCRTCSRVLGHRVIVVAESPDPSARVTFGGVLTPDDYDIVVVEEQTGMLPAGTGLLRPRRGDRLYVPNTKTRVKTSTGRLVFKPRVLHGNVIQRCHGCGHSQRVMVCDVPVAANQVHR